MNRSLLAAATLAGLLALSACSSDDDDESLPGDGSGDTSMEGADRELSSEPGGDTSAIAGYWNASRTETGAASDSRFVFIAENGLQTSYELQQDDVDGSNCYSQAGPQTLTPGADDSYVLDEGTTYMATRSEDGTMLTVTLEPELVETWTLVEGRVPEDLPLCSGEEEGSPAGGENVLPGETVEPDPGESSFNPDLEPGPPSSDPSGNDTAAIAGLWDATDGPTGRRDERFVLISGDGLWTEYDFRQDDLGSEGNCYFVTPLRLDLELGDAASGTYSIADGRTFDVTESGGDTLGLAFGEDAGGANVSWSRVTGQAPEDLEPCEE